MSTLFGVTVPVAYQNFRRDARRATVSGIPAVLLAVLPLLAMMITWPRVDLRPKIFKLSATALALDIPLIFLAIRISRARDRSFGAYIAALETKEVGCKEDVKPYLATMPILISACKDPIKKKDLERKFEKFKRS